MPGVVVRTAVYVCIAVALSAGRCVVGEPMFSVGADDETEDGSSVQGAEAAGGYAPDAFVEASGHLDTSTDDIPLEVSDEQPPDIQPPVSEPTRGDGNDQDTQAPERERSLPEQLLSRYAAQDDDNDAPNDHVDALLHAWGEAPELGGDLIEAAKHLSGEGRLLLSICTAGFMAYEPCHAASDNSGF